MAFMIYKVTQSFTPVDPEGLSTKKNEILTVPEQSPFGDKARTKQGWLYAYNRRTGQEGYVPVDSVILLGSPRNKTIHHPSALGVESVLESESDHFKASHQLKDVYLTNPNLCGYCNDYIWGSGKVGVKCTGKLF